MIYGYARVSTDNQNIDRQIRNIKHFNENAKIYKESFTGTKIDRPEFAKLMKVIKADDTIIFDSVSRMSRNAEEGFELYKELYGKGINLVFLNERHIDTDAYRKALSQGLTTTGNEIADTYIEATNKVLMILASNQIKLAFEQAQIERDDLSKRTKQGIETARLNGKQIGRTEGSKNADTYTTGKNAGELTKQGRTKRDILKYSKDFGGALNDKDCMKMCGCAKNTFYKYKKELAEEQGTAA